MSLSQNGNATHQSYQIFQLFSGKNFRLQQNFCRNFQNRTIFQIYLQLMQILATLIQLRIQDYCPNGSSSMLNEDLPTSSQSSLLIPSTTQPKKRPTNQYQLADLCRAEQYLKESFDITNFDMLYLEEPQVQYTAYIDGLTQFIEAAIMQKVELKHHKEIKKIKLTVNNMNSPTLGVPYQMIESSKKVEKLSPGYIHIQQTKLIGQIQNEHELFDGMTLRNIKFDNDPYAAKKIPKPVISKFQSKRESAEQELPQTSPPKFKAAPFIRINQYINSDMSPTSKIDRKLRQVPSTSHGQDNQEIIDSEDQSYHRKEQQTRKSRSYGFKQQHGAVQAVQDKDWNPNYIEGQFEVIRTRYQELDKKIQEIIDQNNRLYNEVIGQRQQIDDPKKSLDKMPPLPRNQPLSQKATQDYTKMRNKTSLAGEGNDQLKQNMTPMPRVLSKWDKGGERVRQSKEMRGPSPFGGGDLFIMENNQKFIEQIPTQEDPSQVILQKKFKSLNVSSEVFKSGNLQKKVPKQISQMYLQDKQNFDKFLHQNLVMVPLYDLRSPEQQPFMANRLRKQNNGELDKFNPAISLEIQTHLNKQQRIPIPTQNKSDIASIRKLFNQDDWLYKQVKNMQDMQQSARNSTLQKKSRRHHISNAVPRNPSEYQQDNDTQNQQQHMANTNCYTNIIFICLSRNYVNTQMDKYLSQQYGEFFQLALDLEIFQEIRKFQKLFFCLSIKMARNNEYDYDQFYL